MGCFDLNGGISKLPITYKDKCFLIIGVIDKKVSGDNIDVFGNGFLFTPICLPIYGTYNDYGIIENIVRDKNVEFIEKEFEEGIDNIISAIESVFIGRYDKDKKDNKICYKILSKLKIDKKRYKLGISIDHKFIYDSIIQLGIDTGINIKDSLEYTKLLPYTIDDLKVKEVKEEKDDFILLCPEIYLNKLKKEYIKEEYISKKYWGKDKKIENDWYLNSRIINLNINFNEGYYRYNEYYDSNLLMRSYKNDNIKLLLNDLSEEYIRFITFFSSMGILDWKTPIHTYGGQNGITNTKALKLYFENIIKYIDEKIKSYENNN